ncbi:hypothetical protein D3C72_2503220 [compost metagenome]
MAPPAGVRGTLSLASRGRLGISDEGLPAFMGLSLLRLGGALCVFGAALGAGGIWPAGTG